MKVVKESSNSYAIQDVSRDEPRSMLVMINGARLNERRNFHHLKQEIEKNICLT